MGAGSAVAADYMLLSGQALEKLVGWWGEHWPRETVK